MNEPDNIQESNLPRHNIDNREHDDAAHKLDEIVSALDHTRNLLENYLESTKRSGNLNKQIARRGKSWWGRHCWPNGRGFLYRYITLITVALQFLNLMILTVIDIIPGHNDKEYRMLLTSCVTMFVLQVANLIILILATGRLAKQVIHHAVNSFFLAQSYLATLLLFAGFYTLTYRLDKHSWRFLNEDLTSDPIQVFKLYLKFLFFSISTATLCGSDNSLPEYWYNHLFAGTQMLLSFCYFASILGMALSPRQAQPSQRAWNASSRDFRRQVESAPVSSPDTSTLSGKRSYSAPQSQNGKNSSCCDGDNEKIVKESDDVPLLPDDLAYSKGESIVIIEPGDHGFDIR